MDRLSIADAAWQYKDAWNAGSVDRTIALREDIGKPLTGGGLTLDAVNAIQEYIRHCVSVETGKPPAPAWKGGWQAEVNEHIAAHTYSGIQGMRRLGKTYSVGKWLTAAILAGMTGFIGLPTLTQGERQLMRDVTIDLMRLSILFPELQRIRARTFNKTEIDYPFGGRLTVLSADKGAEKEGYGGDIFALDESHKAHKSTLGIFQPFIDDAVKAGHGKFIMLGVGEEKDSALELAKQGPVQVEGNEGVRYSVLVLKASEMVKRYPELQQTVDNAQATMPADGPGGYGQMYEMRPVRPGSGIIFRTPIRPHAEYQPGCAERMYYAGWDPGKRQDQSVVTVLEAGPSAAVPQQTAYNVVDCLELPPGMEYPEQVRTIIAWLKQHYPTITPQRFCVEDNGVGDAAADCVRDVWSRDVGSYFTSDFLNTYYVGELQIGSQQGWIGIHDEHYREEINGLTYTVNDENRVKYEHSDKFASLKCALFAAYFAT